MIKVKLPAQHDYYSGPPPPKKFSPTKLKLPFNRVSPMKLNLDQKPSASTDPDPESVPPSKCSLLGACGNNKAIKTHSQNDTNATRHASL